MFKLTISSLFVFCLMAAAQWGCSNSGLQWKLRGPIEIVAQESEVEYLPGQKTKVWSYNGQVPGPTLHANVGEVVTIKFINRLPEPATMHWHGLELPANMDGSHISQKPVPPGGEFTYQFRVHRAATYWYHSHVKPNEQVEKGLQGMFIVHDPDENKKLGLVSRELPLVLDDILLDEDAQIVQPLPDHPLKRAVTLTNGRIGNLLLANGRFQPIYDAVGGEPIRLRFVNSANSRFFRLSFPGDAYRVGGDTGLLPEPLPLSEIDLVRDPETPDAIISNPDLSKGLLIVPGERAEVIWTPTGDVGDIITIATHDLERGQHAAHFMPDGRVDILPDGADGKKPPQILFSFRITAINKDLKPYTPPKSLRESWSLTPEDINAGPLKVSFGHGPADNQGNVMFFAKAIMSDGMMKPIPYMKLTNETALNAKVSDVRMIEVVNMSRGIHPFHMHGFPFQLVETQYIDMEHPERNRTEKNNTKTWHEWKDTIAVPGRPGNRMKSKTIMRLLVKFDDDERAATELIAHGGKSEGERSGGWMVHCHILEHARFGMATWLNLWPN